MGPGSKSGGAYNTVMKKAAVKPKSVSIFPIYGFALAALAVALAASGFEATAQTRIEPAAPEGRPAQTIQRIRTEDAGSRIDELRVGGQTKSITVQPKVGGDLPAYEIRPSNVSLGAAPSASRSDTTGPRVWNVLKF